MEIPLAVLHGPEFTALLRLSVDMQHKSPSVWEETSYTTAIQLQSLVLLYMAFCEMLVMATLLECSLPQFQVQFFFTVSLTVYTVAYVVSVMNHDVTVYCLCSMHY